MYFKKIIFFATLTLQSIIIGCTGTATDVDNSVVHGQNDSIKYWLAEKNSNSEEEYINNLSKAYDLALQEKNDSLKIQTFLQTLLLLFNSR